ncbi:MAG: hypothetical protein FD149_2215 [Rhodospirillaceae bacterium]|nr:MAG: hypothetical protein FD149_2215 [Rhodospirillaceae bacterium]
MAHWNEERGTFSADDRHVWAQVARTVIPLRSVGIPLREQGRVDSGSPGTCLSPLAILPPTVEVKGGEGACGRWLGHGDDRGLDRRTAIRFRRGRLPLDDRLDLHGLGQAQAHTALRRFVVGAWQSGSRAVLVITGKGSRTDGGIGVLRTAVPLWLNEPDLRPKVVSFRHAQPRDGGEGALYLLIRRQRPEV